MATSAAPEAARLLALWLIFGVVAHAEEASSEAKGDGSFGQALADLSHQATWSAYGDLVVQADTAGSFTFDAWHLNPILGAAPSRRTWVELEIELEHGGEVIKVEYAWMDLEINTALTVRLGRFLVPIGRFNDTLHPSFRWAQVSRPTVFEDGIPAVWSDTGIQLYGGTSGGSARLGYALFAVNGLAGPVDTTLDHPLRDLRAHTLDNNLDKYLGARIEESVGVGAGREEISLSAWSGATNDDGGDRWSGADLAARIWAGPAQLAVEGLLTWLGPDGQLGDPFVAGGYALLSARAGKWEPALRWDLDERLDTKVLRQEGVASVRFVPHPHFNFRGEVALPLAPEGGLDPVRFALMSAFVF